MSFKIYPPEPGDIDPKFQMDIRFLYKNLEKIFASGPVSAIFNTKTSELFPVNVEEINAKNGIKFKIEEMPVNGIQSFLSNPCLYVAGIEIGKLQFSANNLRSVGTASLACDIPSSAVIIQRREDFRVPAPPDRAFKALIFFAIGKEMIADIVDISDEGMQLDLRLGATEMEVGTIWTNCSLERLRARTAPFDLIIQNIRPSPTETSRIRVGVKLHLPTKLNLNEFASTRSAIQNSRLNRRINYWYQDTSWC
jgi:hypothetical protein